MTFRAHKQLLAAALAGAMGILIGGNSVLCIGSDGHVALEQVAAHCCSVSGSDVRALARAPGSSVDQLTGCSECTDTRPLTAARETQPTTDAAAAPPASLAAPAAWPTRGLDLFALALPASGGLPHSIHSLLFARTISLRC